jgi:hypothetical protein
MLLSALLSAQTGSGEDFVLSDLFFLRFLLLLSAYLVILIT